MLACFFDVPARRMLVVFLCSMVQIHGLFLVCRC